MCAFGSIQHIQRKSGIMRFQQICMWIETVRFGDNAVFTKILFCTRILHLIKHFFGNSGPQNGLLLNDAKKMVKTNYKISCMCTFKAPWSYNCFKASGVIYPPQPSDYG